MYNNWLQTVKDKFSLAIIAIITTKLDWVWLLTQILIMQATHNWRNFGTSRAFAGLKGYTFPKCDNTSWVELIVVRVQYRTVCRQRISVSVDNSFLWQQQKLTKSHFLSCSRQLQSSPRMCCSFMWREEVVDVSIIK